MEFTESFITFVISLAGTWYRPNNGELRPLFSLTQFKSFPEVMESFCVFVSSLFGAWYRPNKGEFRPLVSFTPFNSIPVILESLITFVSSLFGAWYRPSNGELRTLLSFTPLISFPGIMESFKPFVSSLAGGWYRPINGELCPLFSLTPLKSLPGFSESLPLAAPNPEDADFFGSSWFSNFPFNKASFRCCTIEDIVNYEYVLCLSRCSKRIATNEQDSTRPLQIPCIPSQDPLSELILSNFQFLSHTNSL